MGKSQLKYLLFRLLSLDLKAGPKNVSWFLQAIWKSIFISSTALLLQMLHWQEQTAHLRSLWGRAAALLAENGFWAANLLIYSLKGLWWWGWSHDVGEIPFGLSKVPEGIPFWATHCSPLLLLNFSTYPFPRKKDEHINPPAAAAHFSVKGREQKQWHHEVSSLTCSTPNPQLLPTRSSLSNGLPPSVAVTITWTAWLLRILTSFTQSGHCFVLLPLAHLSFPSIPIITSWSSPQFTDYWKWLYQ